eukprot:gnl/TRDRNA2_/TRDRNA2_88982_c0_seq1.p1 gnl/TRDRNA2_/TRDRNA2_88982_c0~~gnl/TRDRNA2_/TRDRNA2_88982_c0_seq1.p1  ORF type:complete len:592 (+),score=161.90 gnl/TRDRNA2_/TRDRNA2_88982_c0_seq1:27-1802(+)
MPSEQAPAQRPHRPCAAGDGHTDCGPADDRAEKAHLAALAWSQATGFNDSGEVDHSELAGEADEGEVDSEAPLDKAVLADLAWSQALLCGKTCARSHPLKDSATVNDEPNATSEKSRVELQQIVQELRKQVSAHGELQVQECRRVASRESEAVQERLGTGLATVELRARQLEADVAEQEQMLKSKDRRLIEVERSVRAAVQRLQHKPVESVAEADWNVRCEAELAEIEAMHKTEVEALEAELGEEQEQGTEVLAQLQCELDASTTEAELLAADGKELACVDEAAGQLRLQIQLCDERARELEAARVLLQQALDSGTARLAKLTAESSGLADAAERGEFDMRKELERSEEHEQLLTSQHNELGDAHGAAEALESQLERSNALVCGLEASVLQLHSTVEDLHNSEAAAALSKQDAEALRAHGTVDTPHISKADATRPEAKVAAANAELLDLRARLDARERRVQLLAHGVRRACEAPQLPGDRMADQWRRRLLAAQRRSAELEATVASYGARLDDCERQRAQLREWRQRAERVCRERDRDQAATLQAQRHQIAELEAALASSGRDDSMRRRGVGVWRSGAANGGRALLAGEASR